MKKIMKKILFGIGKRKDVGDAIWVVPHLTRITWKPPDEVRDHPPSIASHTHASIGHLHVLEEIFIVEDVDHRLIV